MGKYLITYRDFGEPGEKSTVTIPHVDITDANIVATSASLDTLRQAMEAIMLGGLESRSLVAWTNDTKTNPANGYAQRENKWLVKYHEDIANGEPHYMEIPTADLSYLDANANDRIDMTNADVIAFVTAFENIVTVNGNACVVDGIYFVARRT